MDLAVRHQPSATEPAAIQMRRVIRRPVDYAELIEVDRIVNDLVAGTLDRGAARDQLAQTVSTGHLRPRWAVMLGWGLLGTGIALTLGGSAVVCLLVLTLVCVVKADQYLWMLFVVAFLVLVVTFVAARLWGRSAADRP